MAPSRGQVRPQADIGPWKGPRMLVGRFGIDGMDHF